MTPILGILASQISGKLNTSSYESIATVTVGSGGSSSISFSSIPSTFKHLQIRWLGRTTGSGGAQDDFNILFNGGSSSNSNYHRIYGNGSSTGANYYDGVYAGVANTAAETASANIFGVGVIDILDYTNTNKNKVSRSFGGNEQNGSGTVWLYSNLSRSTAAITSISLTPVYGTGFVQYSSFALYGIKG
jgi:hypothetical protein